MNKNRKWIWLAAIVLVAVLTAVLVYGIRTDQKFLSLLAGIVIPMVLGWMIPKWKDSEVALAREIVQPQQTVDNLIARYGEPSNVILLNAAKGNDPDGVVLVYDDRNLLIVNGKELKKSEIADVTFNNAAIAYTPNDYQVLLTLRDKQPSIHLYVGYDLELAREITEEIRNSL